MGTCLGLSLELKMAQTKTSMMVMVKECAMVQLMAQSEVPSIKLSFLAVILAY